MKHDRKRREERTVEYVKMLAAARNMKTHQTHPHHVPASSLQLLCKLLFPRKRSSGLMVQTLPGSELCSCADKVQKYDVVEVFFLIISSELNWEGGKQYVALFQNFCFLFTYF